jgi:hypothetical protein
MWKDAMSTGLSVVQLSVEQCAPAPQAVGLRHVPVFQETRGARLYEMLYLTPDARSALPFASCRPCDRTTTADEVNDQGPASPSGTPRVPLTKASA